MRRVPYRRGDGPSSTQVRVLLAVVALTADGGQPTGREVADQLGLSIPAVYAALHVLRRAELVEWTPYRGGSLRPLVREVSLCS